METLLKKQSEIGSAIQDGYRNFKKDSANRKTEPAYYEKRLEKLQTQWDEFQKNHERLSSAESDKESEYFTTDYYQQLEQIYDTFKQKLTQDLATINDAIRMKPGTSANAIQENTPNNKHPDDIEFKIHKDSNETSQPDETVKLVKKQQRMMGILTRHLQEVSNRKDEQLSKMYCNLKIQIIQKSWIDITENDEMIFETTDEPPLGYTQDMYNTLDDWVQETLLKLHENLETSGITNNNERGQHSSLKLPQITLPTFDGSYAKWSHFHDLFIQLIHSQDISNAQKMFYLTSNLSGEPRSLIQHLPATDSNYSAAWEILNERYNNKRSLSTAFFNKLLEQTITQPYSALSIKTLHDTTKECLHGLKNIGISTDTWDPLLVHLLIKKLDKTTHSLYESSLQSPRDLPSIQGLLSFLERRFQALEALGRERQPSSLEHPGSKSSHKYSKAALTSTVRSQDCIICKKTHPLYFCKEFLALSHLNRWNAVKKNKLCMNCLRRDHPTEKCTSRSCRKCSKKHNTLIHVESSEPSDKVQANASKAQRTTKIVTGSQQYEQRSSQPQVTFNSGINQEPTTLTAAHTLNPHQPNVILGTVMVEVSSNNGEMYKCRAILDSGSQLSFITENLARKLNLKRSPETMHILGIGGSKQKAQHRVNLKLQSKVNNYSTQIEAFVLHRITSYQPERLIDTKSWSIPKNIKLADPEFSCPRPVDLLLGADIYYDILSVGQIKLGNQMPTLQNTLFGWVVAGRFPSKRSPYASCGICTEADSVEDQLERFWKLEEVESSDEGGSFTAAEQRCVNHFYQHVKRNNEGRFIVKLPFLSDPKALGESKSIALSRFFSLERKFTKQPTLKEEYVQFMREYERLGHMKEVKSTEISDLHYFLPHHCVTKLDSTTTKLRVVFDGSAQTTSNVSLNKTLCKGPVIQDELFSILIRFRVPKFVFTADIEKMYRQVLLAEEDQQYQLILWREDPTQPIKYYKLCTVTYGLTSAPFLATKCLEYLANEMTLTHPLGSQVLKRDFYVDDVMTGSNQLAEAIEVQRQLKEILQSAGFNLRKWCSNHPKLLQGVPQEDIELELHLNNHLEESTKTLGLIWIPKSDVFCIKTSWKENKRVTKRTVLSDIAHIFDPLGFMSPVIITAKLFIKRLWALKLDWEASLPMEMHTSWLKFREGLKALKDIKIPRHMTSGSNPKSLQIHAFSDASEVAYGAAIYVRAVQQDGIITVRLLCAKSKVAPNKTTTLPRLELCGARLAAQLVHRVIADLRQPNMQSYFWTDSEIVLSWINSDSSSYHTFVANRVATIQRLSSAEQWRHVPSKANPADILSRGIPAEKLNHCNLWFYGPMFLHGSDSVWPPSWSKATTDLEKRKTKVALMTSTPHLPWILDIKHNNSFKRLQRIVAHVLRFIRLLKRHKGLQTNLFTTEELDEALSQILFQIQKDGFNEDLKQLQKHNCVDITSSLNSLSPFIDERGIIRVGGRLENADLPYEAKHPALLPYGHHLTKLLMTDIHLSNLHIGPQALLATTRQRFWPIKGKTIARSIVQQCVRCTKAKPKLMAQLMGNLPPTRVQPARPFINSGVDFCGPIYTHYKTRGKQPQKSYIAVFCCFATKAIHLEIVSDLSTESFLGALKRFIARRGHCQNLNCDNATNFVGANNQLKELQNTIYTERAQGKIIELCQSKGINFNFIPPRAPHFGGLWEAAVKSAKSLLQRTIASASLTYEELSTVAAEIEAVLNSRPITPLSSDPNDLAALTPGHFLIGEPLTAIVDPQAAPQPISLIKRWKLVAHLKQEFWRRWSNEYLSELQHRHKWKHQGKNAHPGMMVLIKEDNLPPLKWQLGRITNTIKGDDGLVRVADIKTASGTFRRPIHKLAPLPLNIEEEASISHNDDKDKHQDNCETEPKPKRAKTSARSALNFMLLTCLIIPVLGNPLVEITPFNSQPGVHFENLGSVHLTSNEWNLIVYYDLEDYWKEFTTITKSINQLEKICNMLTEKDLCKTIIKQLTRFKNQLSNNNELLLPTSLLRREKRAPLNIVGNVASALFGILDSEYANKMSSTIDNIKGNEAHLLDLIKNQTTVVDSTINVLRHGEETLHNQLKDVNKQLNEMVDRINNFTEGLQQQKMAQLFSTLAIEATLMSLNYQHTQESILEVLIDTHHGRFNPQLLTPRQLKKELTTIKDHLPSNLRLPTKQNNILQLYNLMNVEGRATAKYVIFRIRLPLFAFEEFELFHIIPVPVLVNTTFMAIIPSAEFLVINLHRDQYYPLSAQEFEECVTIGEAEHICKQKHPLYRKGANISTCEFGLITHSPPSNICEIVNAEKLPKWIQLHNPNQWIYSVKAPTVINVVCGATMVQQSIEGAGFLKMQKECEIKQEFLTLRAHNVYPQSTRSSFTPSSNLTDFAQPEHFPLLHHIALQASNHAKKFEDLERRIQEIRNEETLSNDLNSTDIHHFTLSYSALLLALIVTACLIYARWKRSIRSNPKIPVPTPRTLQSSQFVINIEDEAS